MVPPDVVSESVLAGLSANVVEVEVKVSALWLATLTMKFIDELVEEAKVELPE